MTLHITKASLLNYGACDPGMERFDMVYPGVDDDQQIKLLEIAENDMFETTDIIWALRATIEDSKGVSVEFVKGCAARVASYDNVGFEARANYAARYAARYVGNDAPVAAATVVAATAAAYATADGLHERKLQREHLIQLLKGINMTQYKLIDFDEKYLGKDGVIILQCGVEVEYISHRINRLNGLEMVVWEEELGFRLVVECSDVLIVFSHLKMKIPVERIRFSLEAWETGKYDVVTRNGLKVPDIAVSKDLLSRGLKFVIAAVIEDDWQRFIKNGRRHSDSRDHYSDLFLLEK